MGGQPVHLTLCRNDTVLACLNFRTLSFWDLTAAEPRLLSTFPGPIGHVPYVFPDGEHVLTHENVTPQLWQATAKGWVKVWEDAAIHVGTINAVAHPSGQWFALYASDGMTIRRTSDGSVVRKIAMKAPPWDMEFAPDGRHLFVANGFNTVYVLRLTDLGVADAAALADRAAAEWVISLGGVVIVNDQESAIKVVVELPKEPFRLTGVGLGANLHVTDAGLAHFKDCKNLVHLGLHATQVSDAGLANFKNCTNLVHLDLRETQVSDAGLAHFKDCKNLVHLGLTRTQVGDAGLAHLKDCNNLLELFLDRTKVTDAGLAHLKDCKSMRQMSLSETQVSDAGLAHLKDWKGMGHLTLEKTRVTAAGVADLAKALPGCQIAWDGGVIEPAKK